NSGEIQAETGNTCGIKASVDLLQLPKRANHQAGTDDEYDSERDLRDNETFAERLTSSSNGALSGAANPVCEVAFTHLGQWRKTEEKDGYDRNGDRKSEYAKTNADLFRAW